MQSVGEKLRRARLEKNVSLEQVYKQTKIHPHVLEALEQDRAHNFLGSVYIRSFLKTYARYLGLDSEKLFKEYKDSQKVETPPSEIALKKRKKTSPPINLFLILRIGLALFLVFALVFYFRYVSKTIFHHGQEAKIQKVKVKVIPAPLLKTEDLVLQVRTKQDCWIRVKTDERVIFQKTLRKGKVEKWQAKEKIELRIGKPEALEVFLNGRPIDLKKAQVKKGLVITHEGIVGK